MVRVACTAAAGALRRLLCVMPSCGAHDVHRAARCFTHASRRVYRPPRVASLRVKIPSCARRISAVTCFLASHEAERTCGRGGIGRRVRFRSVWGQPHGGSSPLARTIANSEPSSRWVFCCPDRASDQFFRISAFPHLSGAQLSVSEPSSRIENVRASP